VGSLAVVAIWYTHNSSKSMTSTSWNASKLAIAIMMQMGQTVYRSYDYLPPPSSSSKVVNLRVVDEIVRQWSAGATASRYMSVRTRNRREGDGNG
jgi:hypothetical protein